jgi:anaerobic magnesium-protoporphyrin IX monomethyl ester cyclase
MQILFIYNGATNLGIEYLSSFLKSKGHRISLLFDPAIFSGGMIDVKNKLLIKLLEKDGRIVRSALSLNPDLIAFSVFTGNYQWCLKIAREIKKQSNIPIVFGGMHVSAVPKVVLSNQCVDYVVVGEGEHAMLELVEMIAKNNIDSAREILNLGYKSDGRLIINKPREYLADLDSLPFPDKQLFYDKVPMLQKVYMISTSRGCAFNCTFCNNSMLHSLYSMQVNHVRRRSPGNVIEELKQAKAQWKIKMVCFADDIFVTSKTWLDEFIGLYKREIAIPFFCFMYPNANSSELVLLLKNGGCRMISIGVESGSERVRKEIFLRLESNVDILRAADLVKKSGIKLCLDHIMGTPTETEEELKSGMALYNKAKPDRMNTLWLTYYPGTKIIDIALEKGILDAQSVARINEGYSGFAHSGGSVRDEKTRELSLKYALLFQLRTLLHSDKFFELSSKLIVLLPFKSLIVNLLILLNAIKINDVKIFNGIRYIFAAKYIP